MTRARRPLPSPRALAFGLITLSWACSEAADPVGLAPIVDTTVPVALTAMDRMTYLGFSGHLYPGGNQMPTAHMQAGLALAADIQPLDTNGSPDPNGTYVLLSIGMSNTTQEFCSMSGGYPCDPWTFVGQALADPAVNTANLQFVNGASSGQVATSWDQPSDQNYQRVANQHLNARGLSELQVQALWIKVANSQPVASLPDPNADAYLLEVTLGDILRAAYARYPNLKLAFISSRIYAGYATTSLNPEPFAYESGLAVKWIIEAQIDQAASGTIADARAGDLSMGQAAPWIGWGPYLWADGSNPNPDGLTWLPSDFESDGTHPAQSAEQKVGAALLSFFKSSPHSTGWFLK